MWRSGAKKLLSYFMTPGQIDALYREYRKRVFLLKYGNVNEHRVQIDELDVVYSTDDYRSKRFFFHRRDPDVVHEEPVTRELIRRARTSNCFLEIGAHIGYYSCLIAKMMKGEGVVFAFEMDRENYRILNKNIELNDCTANVSTYNLAVTDKSGEVAYALHPDSSGAGQYVVTDVGDLLQDGKSVTVRSVSIDSFLESVDPVPDLVKIDVEGAEGMVLMGMTELMQNDRPTVYIEIHPQKLRNYGWSHSEVVQRLADLGYTVFDIGRYGNQGYRRIGVNSQILNESTMLMAQP